MSDISTVNQRLQIKPARKITADEAANTSPPLSKYQTIVKTRPYGFLKTVAKIAQLNLGDHNLPQNENIPVCVYQWNFSASSSFYVYSPYNYIQNLIGVFSFIQLAIRYRVGETVYRYLLGPNFEAANFQVNGENLLNANIPWYNNEPIKKNFVLEAWFVVPYKTVYPTLYNQFWMNNQFSFELSIKTIPDTGDSLDKVILPVVEIESNLYKTLNETIPTDYDPNIAWLDNT